MRFDHALRAVGLVVMCGQASFGSLVCAQEAPPPDDSMSSDLPGKYPPGRNYLQERIDWIRDRQGSSKERGGPVNHWTTFTTCVSQMDGAWKFASEGSTVYRDYAARQQAEATPSTYDIFWSVAKIGTRYDAELDLEGQRIIDQFLRTSTPMLLDSMYSLSPVVPDVSLERPQIMRQRQAFADSGIAANWNVTRMSLARRRGDDTEFLRAAQHNMYLSHAAACDAGLGAHLRSFAIAQFTYSRIIDEHLARPLSPELLSQLVEMLGKIPAADWATSVEGERLLMLDGVDWIYETGRTEMFGESKPQRTTLEKAADLTERMMWAPREVALAEIDRVYGLMARCLDPDIAVADKAMEECRGITHRLQSDKALRRKFAIQSSISTSFLWVNFEKQARCARGGLQLYLAAELFKARNGHLPETAAELVPEYLRSVPIDWYSKTREPMRYKRVDPKTDPLGRGFLVYSVGLDNTDDGGTIDPKRFNRAISSGEAMGKGYDFVINWATELPDRR
ncbi:MAG: hypothetical protein AABZ53_11605 [Planctomycetota bacterium]